MQQLKEECSRAIWSKNVGWEVSSRLGGVVSADDSCEIPHNEQQVIMLRNRMKSTSLPVVCGTTDELGVIKCNKRLGKTSSSMMSCVYMNLQLLYLLSDN